MNIYCRTTINYRRNKHYIQAITNSPSISWIELSAVCVISRTLSSSAHVGTMFMDTV
jgi:hypothetical protein